MTIAALCIGHQNEDRAGCSTSRGCVQKTAMHGGVAEYHTRLCMQHGRYSEHASARSHQTDAQLYRTRRFLFFSAVLVLLCWGR